MKEMLKNDTTLLYVSHNIKSVMNLCTHAIWIDKGIMKAKGEVKEVCKMYTEAQGLTFDD